MPLFTFSEQREPTSERDQASQPRPESDEGGVSQQKQRNSDEVLERLKEDAHVYGWEFDETREVFRPVPAI
ncbi:hypothetical protein AKJ61_04810 [candidate division MSBL1 archaeon SCGC-AAA259B11]|uniref:Uncharacterized protein n=1 Tax=candidate division MSBL1 archaeon SCGC-AAA259B11 TaxID=1698260 RepID=A0A133U2T3_9EURY|nr:hypothetical protein AKJ61_04810 [candidate division MSBL1 archaeon SCGC-AAA259B11]